MFIFSARCSVKALYLQLLISAGYYLKDFWLFKVKEKSSLVFLCLSVMIEF